MKLRNELTQKAIARECADWIRKKVTFKSNTTPENMGGFLNIESGSEQITYMPLDGFTTVDIGCERGNNSYNMVTKFPAPHSQEFIRLFESVWNDRTKLQDVTAEVIENITAAYNENPAEFIYFVALYNIFNEFLEDISEDVLPNEATGFKDSKIWNMLYDFQKDAALAIINKLEKYNGCILADSVGLGKTFTALAVIKYYENRNKSVLVLCPKKLSDNWNTYKDNYINNPIASDRLNYDVLYHTDLSRNHGRSNGLDLDRLNWSNYDLIVIDESHNFRNGGEVYGDDARENRYLRLLNKVIRPGVKTRVLMLSATPVNNRFVDLRNQLALAYEGKPSLINEKLNTAKPIDEIFRNAQRAFNVWSDLEPGKRTTATLLKMLDFDFFEVLDSVTIARSRKHIEKYYNMDDAGKFPVRRKTTIPKFKATFNNVLTCFSPVSKDKDLLMPGKTDRIDILIATDCISEGQNLQDCDYLVNYDIHWNPVRIIQRFGRIDRIGSRNAQIQLVNFWPDLTLDDYINLKSRVETRMKISVMTSTGDDDLINAEEKGDLEYRKAQLKRLQEEVVDIEDMSSGISIMDLGLNEFRLDLLDYIKNNGDLDKTPFGLHAVVPAKEDMPSGVIFVLKNINGGVNIDNRNRLHPFHMVYIADDGEVVCDHLSPKEILDKMRYLCKGKTFPLTDLCRDFNQETDDGRNMRRLSNLLSDAINSIIAVKEESDIDSLFRSGGTSALNTNITGLDDFELICFLVVRGA